MTKNLRKLQLCELAMLQTFANFCDKHQLTYYISGGTFLGAVRHQGFIPWDDDIDVAMPRADYEKFLRLYHEAPEKYKLENFRFSKNYIIYSSRLVDESIKIKSYSTATPQISGAWIDIFPLDGLPNNPIVRRLHQLRLNYLKLLYKLSCFDQAVNIVNRKKSFKERLAVTLGKHINFSKFLNTRKRLEKLDRALKKYSTPKSKVYMNYMGAYNYRSIMNIKEIYSDGAKYRFENSTFTAPKNYHVYLTQIYGDYLTPPPKGSRNQHNSEVLP